MNIVIIDDDKLVTSALKAILESSGKVTVPATGYDGTDAIELYEKSCAANNDLGCNGLGAAYANGLGVSQDMQKAKDYFKKACDLNYKEGCDNYKRLQ